MHELSIALSILDLVAQEAHQRHARVLAVHLRLGPLCGVVSSALMSAFELASQQLEHHDCRLVVEEMPITIYCATCAAEKPAESLQCLCCHECGTPASQLLSGRELEVVALELEVS